MGDSTTCLEVFLAFDGMFHILNLLQISPGSASKLHILGCIIELCEYPRCMDQLLYWKRKGNEKSRRWSYGAGFRHPEIIKGIPGDEVGQRLLEEDMSFAALLCELWRDEEERLGVLRDKNGVIACKF